MQIEVYTVVKDDGTYLPFFIDHYRKAFPGCTFTIFNNGCTASMIDYMKAKDCTIKNWGPYSERKLQITKNTCWQTSKADWVIVCDVDEIAEICLKDIEDLPESVRAISFQGYQMLSRKYRKLPLEELTHGVISDNHSKFIMFNPIPKSVVYDIGAHHAKVKGPKSEKVFRLLHYNQGYLNHIHIAEMRHFLYRNIHRILEDKS